MTIWRRLGLGLTAAFLAALASAALGQPPPLPGQVGAPPAAAAQPTAIGPAPAGEIWYVEQSGTPYGPMDIATVRTNIGSGALVGSNLAWRPGFTGWTPISAIPDFAGGGAAPPSSSSPPSTPPPSSPPPSSPPPLPSSAPPSGGATGAWYVEQNGQRAGPMDAVSVMANIQSGALSGANVAWRQGMGAWAPISTIPEFATTLACAPPPLPSMDASRAQLIGTWESAGGMGMGPMGQRLRITLSPDGTYRARTEMCAQVSGFPICNGHNQNGNWTSQLAGGNQVVIQTSGGGGGGGANPFSAMTGGGSNPLGAILGGGSGGNPFGSTPSSSGGGISGTWTLLDANTLTNASGAMLRRVG